MRQDAQFELDLASPWRHRHSLSFGPSRVPCGFIGPGPHYYDLC